MTNIEFLQLGLSLLWTPFVALMMAKRGEEKKEKEKLAEEVQELKTEIAVIQNTTVTEVSLRDYISKQFRESDIANRRELERLETKIDKLGASVEELIKNIPKRKGESN